MTHQASLLPPSGYFAVHEVEEETEWHEGEGSVEVSGIGWSAETVAERGEDGHDTTEAYLH